MDKVCIIDFYNRFLLSYKKGPYGPHDTTVWPERQGQHANTVCLGSLHNMNSCLKGCRVTPERLYYKNTVLFNIQYSKTNVKHLW